MATIKLGHQKGIDHLQIVEEGSLGPLAPDDVLIRVEASSLNQHDLNVVLGRLPCQPDRVLLTDAAGVVERVGEQVTEFAVGDRVISCFFPTWHKGQQTCPGFSTTPGDGVDGYAQPRVIRPASWFTHAPRHMSLIEAATLPTAALTAWRAVVIEGETKLGDVVLILGTGGVSLFALQMAKALGAHVIATTSSDEKVSKLRDLGADEVINYRTTPDWGTAVRSLTNDKGVDLVVEIGGPGTLGQSMIAGKVGGVIALIGVLTGIQGQVPTAQLMTRQQRLQGITVGNRSQQQTMVADLERWSIRPVLDKTFALSDIGEAFRLMQSSKHFGKITVAI